MQFKKFIEATDSTLPYQQRVDKGLTREQRIMDAMTKQCKLPVTPASPQEDMLNGIDGHLKYQGRIWSIQIKARESGNEDTLFIVSEKGNPGKDMRSKAEIFCILIYDHLYLIKTASARKVINDLLEIKKRQYGDTPGKFRIPYKGITCTINYQIDPVSLVPKIMAYIPHTMFTEFIDPIIPPCRLKI